MGQWGNSLEMPLQYWSFAMEVTWSKLWRKHRWNETCHSGCGRQRFTGYTVLILKLWSSLNNEYAAVCVAGWKSNQPFCSSVTNYDVLSTETNPFACRSSSRRNLIPVTPCCWILSMTRLYNQCTWKCFPQLLSAGPFSFISSARTAWNRKANQTHQHWDHV